MNHAAKVVIFTLRQSLFPLLFGIFPLISPQLTTFLELLNQKKNHGIASHDDKVSVLFLEEPNNQHKQFVKKKC